MENFVKKMEVLELSSFQREVVLQMCHKKPSKRAVCVLKLVFKSCFTENLKSIFNEILQNFS